MKRNFQRVKTDRTSNPGLPGNVQHRSKDFRRTMFDVECSMFGPHNSDLNLLNTSLLYFAERKNVFKKLSSDG